MVFSDVNYGPIRSNLRADQIFLGLRDNVNWRVKVNQLHRSNDKDWLRYFQERGLTWSSEGRVGQPSSTPRVGGVQRWRPTKHSLSNAPPEIFLAGCINMWGKF